MPPHFEVTEFVNPIQFFQGSNSYEPVTAGVGGPGVDVEFDLSDLECSVQDCNPPGETANTVSVGVSSGSNQKAVVNHGHGTIDCRLTTNDRLEKTIISKNYFNVWKKTSSTEAEISLVK